MKSAARTILTFFAFIATYFFIYWVPFSLIPGARNIPFLANIVALLIAAAVCYFFWKKTGSMSHSLASSVFMGGIIVGAVGFILGFFGPLIITPEANLGPLLGIFVTGPLGFVVGLIGGGVYWAVKRRKKVETE